MDHIFQLKLQKTEMARAQKDSRAVDVSKARDLASSLAKRTIGDTQIVPVDQNNFKKGNQQRIFIGAVWREDLLFRTISSVNCLIDQTRKGQFGLDCALYLDNRVIRLISKQTNTVLAIKMEMGQQIYEVNNY